MNDKPLLLFFLITYIISWTFFVGVGIGLGVEQLAILGVLGPSLAVLVLRKITDNQEEISGIFKRALKWNFDYRLYLVIIFGFVILELILSLLAKFSMGNQVISSDQWICHRLVI